VEAGIPHEAFEAAGQAVSDAMTALFSHARAATSSSTRHQGFR
jgi:hypothetical protein